VWGYIGPRVGLVSEIVENIGLYPVRELLMRLLSIDEPDIDPVAVRVSRAWSQALTMLVVGPWILHSAACFSAFRRQFGSSHERRPDAVRPAEPTGHRCSGHRQ